MSLDSWPGPWWMTDPRVRLDRVPIQGTNDHLRVLRDDLLDPLASGNKARKLDGWLPLLQREGVDTLVTCGGVQSSWTTALAAWGAAAGLQTHVLARGEAPTPLTGYAALTALFAEVHRVDRDRYAAREGEMEALAASLRARGRKVALLPEGGRALPGLYGYLRLIDRLLLEIDDPFSQRLTLVIDCGTGTSAAGLAIGIARHKLPWEIHGVMLLPGQHEAFETTLRQLAASFEATHGALRAQPTVLWCERARARRFGDYDDDDLRAIRDVARTTGVLLDPIYTLAAWQHAANLSKRERARAILLHSGGQLGVLGVAQRSPHWLSPPPRS